MWELPLSCSWSKWRCHAALPDVTESRTIPGLALSQIGRRLRGACRGTSPPDPSASADNRLCTGRSSALLDIAALRAVVSALMITLPPRRDLSLRCLTAGISRGEPRDRKCRADRLYRARHS